jgi:hypothetical protein
MFTSDHSKSSASRQSRIVKWLILGLLGTFGVFLFLLIVTGKAWWAVGYAIIALGAFLILMAVYFWGAVVLGGLLVALGQRSRAPSWTMPQDKITEIPEHDIDPGLELAAAGMLVYRFGEVKPQVYFRNVPLANARAIRPFVVARTGVERPYEFEFSLTDENDNIHFEHEFLLTLHADPRLVMPPYRLLLGSSNKFLGQRWNLRVRSGVTVVTSFRFLFVDQPEPSPDGQGTGIDELPPSWQYDLLSRLLDEAIKRDVMSNTQEIELEDSR